jgi:hypothetical protein
MTLRESHADRGQVYLIIRLGDFSYSIPKTLPFCQSSGADLPRAQIAPRPVITTRRSATGCP